jgi:predicted nucleic acid-binding protein
MILVDTSIWVSHFRMGNSHLATLLNNGEVVCHPFVVGELACGNMKNRKEILSLLQTLQMAEMAGHQEVLHFIEYNQLMGKGLGYIDVHLLASALLTKIPLWTSDKKLKAASAELGLSY